MKKLVAIFLLFQVASNNAFAEELIKMPGLITHYFHHTEKHGEQENFFAYLHQHYCDTHAQDSHTNGNDSEDSDCNLPFKHCNDCCINIHSPAIGFLPAVVEANSLAVLINTQNFIPENDKIESLELASIWQPPKLA